MFLSVVSWLIGLLPNATDTTFIISGFTTGFNLVQPYISTGSMFFPVNTAMQLLLAYLFLRLAAFLINLLLKLLKSVPFL